MFPHRIETTIAEKGVLHLESLPFESGDEVEITIHKQTAMPARRGKRTVGEYVGKIHMSDDFDAPLPDSFWLDGPD
uniref:Uncharacterized protein n=1 Tax=Candidatus Kentrum sp. DK TaxID=2126562 RepID=A0A450SA27_9GAMM|nr:MAG: hypothetical protein BECKDK2373B_GA0170837_10223 [Candidatus Kentron sp. DK]